MNIIIGFADVGVSTEHESVRTARRCNAGPECFGTNRSMTDYDTPQLERVARKPVVGIDRTGAMHRFDVHRQTVYVETGERIEHIEILGERQLSAWVDYVATERGWCDLRYTDQGFGAQLAGALGDER